MKNAEKVVEILMDNHIYADVWTFVEDLVIDLKWEDWKTHIAVRKILNNLFGADKWVEKITNTDGSDCYSARYVVSGGAL